MSRNLYALLVVLFLASCGGGAPGPPAGDPDLEQPHPHHPYSRPGYVRPTYPYLTGSPRGAGIDSVRIGGDVGPKSRIGVIIPSSSFDTGIEISMGPSRDGIGPWRLLDYYDDLEEVPTPFKVRPRLWLEDVPWCGVDCVPRFYQLMYLGVAILNDVLPPEFQIEFAGTFSSSDEYDRLYSQEGNIGVLLGTPSQIDEYCGTGAAACAFMKTFNLTNHMFSSGVLLPEAVESMGEHAAMTLILHELLHALGIRSHVDSIQFPDSIMGTHGDFFPTLPFVLHRIDAEFLQAMYMSQKTDSYNDWDTWSDTALHLMGRSGDGMVNFGTALFNGLPQPWARGVMPDVDLDDNPGLRGTATWKGYLLGFSGVSPIMGGAGLRVNLRTLEGELKFGDIIFANRLDEATYFPVRNIDYDVEIAGNGFWNTDGDGFVVGSFMGPQHEGMGGTVKRTDLVGAFGGKRERDDLENPRNRIIEKIGSFTNEFINDSFHQWGLWGKEGTETLFKAYILGEYPFIRQYIDGTLTGSNPTLGSAVWTGDARAWSFSARGPTEGSSRLEMDLDAATIDVSLTFVEGDYGDMTWRDLRVVDGAFTDSRGSTSNRNTIEGAFYGADHQGVAGSFERDGTEGVFGALRQ